MPQMPDYLNVIFEKENDVFLSITFFENKPPSILAYSKTNVRQFPFNLSLSLKFQQLQSNTLNLIQELNP